MFCNNSFGITLTDAVKGKQLNEILNFDKGVEAMIEGLMELIRVELGNLPKTKWHCPPASIEALLKALQNYFVKVRDDQAVKNLEQAISALKPYYRMGRGQV